MIETVKIRFGFRNATDAQVNARGGSVLQGMRDNPSFPDPPVPMETLRKTNDEFTAAIAAALVGGKAATADKNKKRHEVIDELSRVGVSKARRAKVTD